MKSIVIFGAIATCIASTYTEEIYVQRGGISVKLFCTSMGNKQACIDKTPRTWTQASAYCTSLGLQLASPNSTDELAALDQSSAAELMDGKNYWTSGRDSQTFSQFVWDDNTPISADLEERFQDYYRSDFQSCVFFRKQGRKQSLLSFAPCSAQCFTLCETLPATPTKAY